MPGRTWPIPVVLPLHPVGVVAFGCPRPVEWRRVGECHHGSTGAGVKPGATTHFSWRNNNMSIYKAFNHQHVPEICQSLRALQSDFDGAIDFIPYRGDFARGIFATEVVRVDASVDAGYFAGLYKEYYKDAAFTHYVDKAIDMKQVVNTNKALVHLDKFGDKLLVTATIDNLLKGASGQPCRT